MPNNDVETRCPVCGQPLDWRAGQAGPVLCLRCGARVDVPVIVGPPEPVAVPASEADTAAGIPGMVATPPVSPLTAPATHDSTDLPGAVAGGGRVAGAAVSPLSPSGQPPLMPDEPAPSVPQTAPGARRNIVAWSGWIVAACFAVGWALTAALLMRPATSPSPQAEVPFAVLPALPEPTSAPAEPPPDFSDGEPTPAPAGASPPDQESPLVAAPQVYSPPEVPAVPSTNRSPTVATTQAVEPTHVAEPDAPPTPPTPPGEPATQPLRRAVVVRPAPVALPPVVKGVTDEQIGAAVQRGVDWMLGAGATTPSMRDAMSNAPGRFKGAVGGPHILGVYALLQCGKAIDDPRLDIKRPHMSGLVDAIRDVKEPDPAVYTRGIRATALAMYARKQDRATLATDVKFLLGNNGDSGRYGYGGPVNGGGYDWWDNSNSQYGLLGVWAGAEAAIEVPNKYWKAVRDHWAGDQSQDGGWGYTGGVHPTVSMTAAGTASLFVAEEYLDLANRRDTVIGRPPLSRELAMAMAWWAEGDRAVNVADGQHTGYTLYGIERVGLASGYKHLGRHDWYRVLAEQTIARQGADGSWGNDLVETSFALLFLARGRHPILMNKLAYQGFWNNRPRDTANLSAYAGKRLEREFNWQVVDARADWADWLDSPVLYIAGHQPIPFREPDLARLRSYVEAGGTIFTHADGDSGEYNRFVRVLATKLFPQYELTDLPPDHPIYSALFDLKQRPPLQGVRNGARLLLVHSPRDLAKAWHRRDALKNRNLFELGVNVFVYAAGKRDFRNRLAVTHMPESQGAPNAGVRVARLKYAGNWDPEPGAWRHFAAVLKQRTAIGLEPTDVPLKELTPEVAPIAHLTGTTDHTFTDEERAAIRAYVEAGGVVVADPCGGGTDFAGAARQFIVEAFPDTTLRRMPRSHPLLNTGPPGMADLSQPRLRQSTTDRRNAGNTYEMLRAGEGCVLIAPIDVTCGLLGLNALEVRGYAPDYAQALMTNTIFWTLDGQPETD